MDLDARYSEADIREVLRKQALPFRAICFRFFSGNVGEAKEGMWKVLEMFDDVEKYKDPESGEESYRIIASGETRKDAPKIADRRANKERINGSRKMGAELVDEIREVDDEETYKEKTSRQACWKQRYNQGHEKKLKWPRMSVDMWLEKFAEEFPDLTYPPRVMRGKKAAEVVDEEDKEDEFDAFKEMAEKAVDEAYESIDERKKESAVGKIRHANFTELNEHLMAQKDEPNYAVNIGEYDPLAQIAKNPESKTKDFLTLRQQNLIMRSALQEITKKMGSYNRDPLKHAENVIENMAEIAAKSLEETK